MQTNLLLFTIVLLICTSVFIFVFLLFRILYMRKIIFSDQSLYRRQKYIGKSSQIIERMHFNPYKLHSSTFFLAYKLGNSQKTERLLDFDPTYFTLFHRIRKIK